MLTLIPGLQPSDLQSTAGILSLLAMLADDKATRQRLDELKAAAQLAEDAMNNARAAEAKAVEDRKVANAKMAEAEHYLADATQKLRVAEGASQSLAQRELQLDQDRAKVSQHLQRSQAEQEAVAARRVAEFEASAKAVAQAQATVEQRARSVQDDLAARTKVLDERGVAQDAKQAELTAEAERLRILRQDLEAKLERLRAVVA